MRSKCSLRSKLGFLPATLFPRPEASQAQWGGKISNLKKTPGKRGGGGGGVGVGVVKTGSFNYSFKTSLSSVIFLPALTFFLMGKR